MADGAGCAIVWNKFTEADVWTQADLEANKKNLWTFYGNATNEAYAWKCGDEVFLNNPIFLSDNNNYQRHTGDKTSVGTNWFCAAVTWDCAAGQVNSYFNGVLDQPETLGTTVVAWTSAVTQIQAATYRGGRLNKANMAHLAIWNAELTAAEIANLASA